MHPPNSHMLYRDYTTEPTRSQLTIYWLMPNFRVASRSQYSPQEAHRQGETEPIMSPAPRKTPVAKSSVIVTLGVRIKGADRGLPPTRTAKPCGPREPRRD